MKHQNPLPFARCAAILGGWLLASGGSQAAPLAYEGFDYAPGTGNLTGSNGGYGWGGTWQTVNNGSADLVAGNLTASASAPAGFDAGSTGNSLNLPNNRRVGRKLNTSATGPFAAAGLLDGGNRIGADNKTVYLSFIQQPNGTTSYYEFEFHRDNLGDGGRIGGIGNDQGGDNVNLRAPNGTHTLVGPGNTGVNFYVVRIDFKPGNDDVYVYQNPASLTEPGVPTLTRLGAADMSFNGLSIGAFNNSRTVAHDEVRVGTTWADVTVPASALPTFVKQPRAATTAQAGGSLTLNAFAISYPAATYKWYKGATELVGQTSSSLTIPNVQPSDAGTYHVVATNTVGDTDSGNAVVTVNTPAAGLLAYEGFDYDTGTGNLPGMGGGLGWASPWTQVDNAGGNVVTGSLAAGNNGPNGHDAQSTGNSLFMPNAQRDGRRVDTSAGGKFGLAGYVNGNYIGADGKTLYISFLQQPNGTTKFYEFEFHRDNLGDPGRIGGVGNDTNNPTVSLRTGGGAPTLIGPGSTGVNLYVIRIDFKPGNDDVYVYQNPVSATEPGTATLFKADAADMSFNGISLAAFDNGRTVMHDEIRMGQSWSDVVFGTSRRQLTWLGNGTTNLWNTTATNWDAGSGATAFSDGDPVTFNNTGSDTPAISVPANVSTASITVDNSTKNYTVGGAGTINSSGGLTKSGTGSFTLTAPSTFNSAITVNGGSLLLNGTSSVGSNLNIDAGTTSTTLGGTNTFSGTAFLNSGTTTLSGTNTFSGLIHTQGSLSITGPTSINGIGGSLVFMGNLAGSNVNVTVENGGSLSMTGPLNDAWVIGRDGGSGTFTQNGGTVTYNPSNRGEAFIGASATNTATAATYNMNGGTLEMSTQRLGVALGPITAHLNQSGGTINVRQLDLAANLNTGTAFYDFTGGRINIGTNGITSTNNLYHANLGGGTLGALSDWFTILTLNLTGINGNTTVDTGDRFIGLFGSIVGTGGLVKNGSGVLELSGVPNNYTGATTINAGIVTGTGSPASAFTLASGTTLAPGVFGTGTFQAASVSFSPGSTLDIGLDTFLDGADMLSASGAVNISGAGIIFDDAGLEEDAPGTSYTIVQGASVTGTFDGYPNGAEVVIGVNTYTISYSATQVKLTVGGGGGDPYTTWAAGKGLDGSPGKNPAFAADPDQDGIANGLEWVLGGEPLSGTGASRVTATRDASGLHLAFTREEGSIGIANVTVEWSTSLTGTWTSVPVTQSGGSYANGVTVTVNEASTPDAVTVLIPAANAPTGKIFARVRAIKP